MDDGETLSVSNNKCKRGVVYAQEEIRAPKRTVTATCMLEGDTSMPNASSVRRVPVKTSSPCLRDKIPSLLQDIYKTKVTLPIKAGDIVISNWNGEGIDIIATRSLHTSNDK
jgi:CxxC motif-containing protein